MITLTEQALNQIKKIITEQGKPNWGIRFGIQGGGCSGLQYKFDIVENPEPKDHVVAQDGVKIFIDPKSGLYIKGMVMDWHSDIMGSNFVFNNPNAKQSCGCGTSFSV